MRSPLLITCPSKALKAGVRSSGLNVSTETLADFFETSKLIRQKGITIPIIAVTAFDKQDIEEKIIDAQIDEVIVKPFESHKLFETIKRLVDK